MPTVIPGGKVLVTGANGYIAMWVIRKLLDQGYSIRGTVRSDDKAEYLRHYFNEYTAKVEFVVVENISMEGAFDESMRGVDVIHHIASPVGSGVVSSEDVITSAVEGTIGILKSALREGGNIRRIIITSSMCTILPIKIMTPPQTVSENDWCIEHVQIIEAKGQESTAAELYRASKVLAEQSAWEFGNRHKPEVTWDLVTLIPPLVLGPPLRDFDHPTELNTSLEAWFNAIFLDQPEARMKGTYGYIHVEDLAMAHVISMEKESAGGERIIVSAGTTTAQATRNLIRKMHPDYYATGILPIGNPDSPGEIDVIYASQKGKEILGINYVGIDQVADDTLAYFKAQGWLEKKYSREEHESTNMLVK